MTAKRQKVALFTRAWIEINDIAPKDAVSAVALFTRAWIEIPLSFSQSIRILSRPLHEGVD